MIKHFTSDDFLTMSKSFRRHFFNSLGGYKSLCLLGTVDIHGNTNLSLVSSVVHLGADPALIGFISRPDSVERHSLENIMQTKYYTLNHVQTCFYKNAHQTSARYPKEVSEFKACGFTEKYSTLLKAPYVLESAIQIGLEMVERIDITINGTILVIGLVKETFLPTDCLLEDGFVDLARAETITVSGLDSYHTTQKIGRLSYAKPDKPTEII